MDLREACETKVFACLAVFSNISFEPTMTFRFLSAKPLGESNPHECINLHRELPCCGLGGCKTAASSRLVARLVAPGASRRLPPQGAERISINACCRNPPASVPVLYFKFRTLHLILLEFHLSSLSWARRKAFHSTLCKLAHRCRYTVSLFEGRIFLLFSLFKATRATPGCLMVPQAAPGCPRLP